MTVERGSGSCSDAWANLPARGTASPAAFVVAVEQPGPWGKTVFSDPWLPEPVVRLSQRMKELGGKVLLIRRTGSHVAEPDDAPRRVYVAGGRRRPWLVSGMIDDVAGLDQILASMCAQTEATDLLAAVGWLAVETASVALVCANSKRDVCCAVKGRPLANGLAEMMPAQVWECSHIGGHRFAPTALILPTLQAVARVGVDELAGIVRDADQGLIAVGECDRGLSFLGAAEQAAESWLRAEVGESRLAACETYTTDAGIIVDHDGTQHLLYATKVEYDQIVPMSCGKSTGPATAWEIDR